jgi:predicted RecA/RadA family phage recombinase
MKNFIAEGDIVNVVAPAAVVSGQFLKVGDLFGVCQTAAAINTDVPIATRGVFEGPKVSAQAWTQGVKIYWDDTAKLLTTVLTSNKLVGVATKAAINPSATGQVLLVQSIVTTA